MKRAEAQDFSLKNKMGRDLQDLTVGVIGTGRIGQVLLKHLSGFGCRLLAYDRTQKKNVKQTLCRICGSCNLVSLQ